MKNSHTRFQLNISQIIALVFLLLIIIGACLLMLPFSTRAAEGLSPLTAFFTATSSVCVTGLSLVDVYSTFTFFGQLVIITLIEIGGLGFMSVLAVLFYVMNHKNNIQSLSLMAESLGSDGVNHIIRIQRRLLIGSVSFELIGAVILFTQYVRMFNVPTAIWFGLFHSISSFCNAGFDLMGKVSPGTSLISVNKNPVILTVLALLTIVGGIGFIVWDDIASNKKMRNWSVNTKLVLSVSVSLLVIGTISFLLMEYNNPLTFGPMNAFDKVINAFFQSASTRTAGFAAVSQGDLRESSIALTILLMIIGGSAGSTAGGVKTVTFIILVKAILSGIQGKKTVTLMGRQITNEQITYAFTVLGSTIILSIFGGFLIDLSSGLGLIASYFESVSALATVGLSLGITGSLSVIAKIFIMFFMYIGRVGLITLTVGFFKAKENKMIKYPSARLMIG